MTKKKKNYIAHLERLFDLSLQSIRAHAMIVVWPEGERRNTAKAMARLEDALLKSQKIENKLLRAYPADTTDEE